MLKFTPLWLALVLPGALNADALADLRATLGRLHGTEAIHARADIQRWHKEGEGKKARIKEDLGARSAD